MGNCAVSESCGQPYGKRLGSTARRLSVRETERAEASRSSAEDIPRATGRMKVGPTPDEDASAGNCVSKVVARLASITHPGGRMNAGPEMRKVGSKTRAGRQSGDASVGLVAGKTLGTASSRERASAGESRQRRERRVLGKPRLTAASEGLEESNPKRGAARIVVNNCGAMNAASRG